MKKVIFLVLCIALVIPAVISQSEPGDLDEIWFSELKPYDNARFISPDTCGMCHDEIHDMWDGSMHANAIRDPLFVAASKLLITQVENEGERADANHCVACHNPIAYRSGQISGVEDDYSNVDEVTRHSISCDLCHSVDEVVMTMNASINATPGEGEDDPGEKRGPRDDAQPMFHEAVYSEIHTSAEFCGACHNVTHLSYYTRLEGTYTEWYHSPYNNADSEQRVVCQDCHMRQAPGNPATGMTGRPDYPGSSAMMGKERDHIWRHSVVGANIFTPELLETPEKAALARERLEHAAELELIAPESGQVSEITVRVRNTGAGHMLPTGVTEFREMWLEIIAKDRNGTTIYSSGGIGPDGELVDGACVYHTVFGDPDGNPTINVARASMILYDRRIYPKGYDDAVFALGEAHARPVTVTATLKYRSMSPALAGTLLGREVEIPVVTMAAIEETIR